MSGLLLSVTAAFASGCSSSHSGGAALGSASSESTSAVPVAPGSRMAIAGSRAVDAYVELGGRIKSCWFNADAPLLPNHVYRAKVSADGSKVQITIHEKEALGRPGLSTYAIDFREEGNYTVVSTENRKMSARSRRQDAIRHRTLEARRDQLQPGDAAGRRFDQSTTIESEMAGTSPAMTA